MVTACATVANCPTATGASGGANAWPHAMVTSSGSVGSASDWASITSLIRSPSKSPTASAETSPEVAMANGFIAVVPVPT